MLKSHSHGVTHRHSKTVDDWSKFFKLQNQFNLTKDNARLAMARQTRLKYADGYVKQKNDLIELKKNLLRQQVVTENDANVRLQIESINKAEEDKHNKTQMKLRL